MNFIGFLPAGPAYRKA